MTDYEQNSLKKLGESIMSGKWSNEGLVELIELAGGFLNLQTIPDYAEKYKISYQAAKKETRYRTIVTIFNTKFIIDNQ
jgi:hypothetical protein